MPEFSVKLQIINYGSVKKEHALFVLSSPCPGSSRRPPDVTKVTKLLMTLTLMAGIRKSLNHRLLGMSIYVAIKCL